MSAYDDLMSYTRETQALAQIAGRLGWDQETMMPRGAAPQRAEEMAAMESVLHARRTAPELSDWLAAVDDSGLNNVGQAQMRHIRRDHARNTKVPARLASEIARVTSRSQGLWAEARKAEDVAGFLPVQEEVLRLRREEAAALADGGDLYDALLQDYEPGASGRQIAAMFGTLRPGLVALRAAVLERPAPAFVTGDFDENVQIALSAELARVFGYDPAHGRIDKAVHPFASGSGLDVRITTRTSATDPFNCLYSTVHEVGHACYEQGIDADYLLTPLGSGVSMGVHESQSRIFENQLGRSEAFCGWLHRRMKTLFPGQVPEDAARFYAAVNAVRRGFIRTEADEVQYNLHVLLRFDLERALISGDLLVGDLEAAWNDRFEADFGYPVDRPSNGVLQDVHWPVGLMGYFPTYTLGNVYAGCLHAALRRDVPDLDDHLAAGETSVATTWLRDKVQRHGGLMEPRDVIAQATGEAPSEAPLLAYLQAKFGAIYGL